MLNDKNILVGVTGGIAAYKTVSLVSLLKKKGANVKVVMTEHATKFVTPLTFQTMSENPVYVDMFQCLDNMEVEHIALAKWADVIVVAPATANTIAKINFGIADNMLTTVLAAKRSPVLLAPAMNTKMMDNVATRNNLKDLKEKDFVILPTDSGRLACGDTGSGKMLEPETIAEYIEMAVTPSDLEGKKVIVTASSTRESLDPVRFLANRSSGKMGYAVARAARNRGADVTLITGPNALEDPPGMNIVKIQGTFDMFDAVGEYFEDCDILVCPAAPADYTPKSYSNHKIKKGDNDREYTIELKATPDILKYYGNRKGDRIVVGFAAESRDIEDYAREKLKKKNLDFIVANNITKEGAGFSGDTNIVTIVDGVKVEQTDIIGKDELASVIMDKITELLRKKS